MKERPIIFSAAMVNAILQGKKTQTRRSIKIPKNSEGYVCIDHGNGWWPFESLDCETIRHDVTNGAYKCPYGKVGDRLWARETHGEKIRKLGGGTNHQTTAFKATEPHAVYCYDCNGKPTSVKWKSAIFMRRTSSRILLEITDITVEKLHDISNEAAISEGLTSLSKDGKLFKYGIPDLDGLPGNDNHGWHWKDWNQNPVKAYQTLFERLNGPEKWQRNPWVWVITFVVVKPERVMA